MFTSKAIWGTGKVLYHLPKSILGEEMEGKITDWILKIRGEPLAVMNNEITQNAMAEKKRENIFSLII